MKRGRPLSQLERQHLAELRERLALCERFRYTTAAREIRRKIDALCKGRDLEAVKKGL